jgi:hypothetical protein
VLPPLLHILLSVAPGDVVTVVSSLYVYYVLLQSIKCLKVAGVACSLPARADLVSRAKA